MQATMTRPSVATTAGVSPVQSYRVWVTQHRITAAILAGVVATQIATICGYWMTGIGLPQLDWNRANGAIYSPDGNSLVQFATGGAVHYLDGIVFTIMFAVAIHPMLPWRNTGWGNFWKAMVFSTFLGLFSLGFMIPRVFFPKINPGFFSFNLGLPLVFAVLLWHWIYGLHLAAIYNPLPDDEISEASGPRS